MAIDHEVGLAAGPDPAPGAPGAASASGPRRLGLLRPASTTEPDLEPDEAQRSVVERALGSGPVVVVGGPGTGKTTTLLEAVTARVVRDGLRPDALLVLAPTRLAADALRDRLTRRITSAGAAALYEPPVRTAASYAFSLIRRRAAQQEEPAPRLISGPEQDAILADLLAGHAAGEGIAPGWPDSVRPALGLRGFRHELRDLLMRAMERGLTPPDLRRLARTHHRPEWQAAATVYSEYLDVTALATPGAFDPAALVDEAASMLAADPELLAAERARLRLVAVDDHHESSEAVARLLDQLAPPGTDLILTGDPDAATMGFRGAQPRLLGEAAERYPDRDGPATVIVLTSNWRHGPELAQVSQRAVVRVGALPPAAAARRAARPRGPAGQVCSAVLRSSGAQSSFIATQLRRAHLLDEVPWSRQAVIVRTSGQASALRRSLAQAGVPIGHSTAEVALRDEPAVRALLLAAEAALSAEVLTDDAVLVALLTGIGGADHLQLRQLRAALVRRERAGGGQRSSSELLAELLQGAPTDQESTRAEAPGQATDEAERPDPTRSALGRDQPGSAAVAAVTAVLSAGREALSAPHATAESVLWALWDATGFAERWRDQALAGGRRGRRADRDLDTMVALFEAAARFADRMPGAGAAEFIERLREQELPADSVAARAIAGDAVVVTTAQSLIGQEFDLVVLAGLQDGVWPNTRLRGSLLGSTDLVDLVAGRAVGGRVSGTSGSAARVVRDAAALRAARAEVLHDELRMLYVAVSRARRRLVITAVANADDVPSPFLDLLDPLPDDQPRPIERVGRAVSLGGVVTDLRRGLADPTDARRRQAAAQLNRLAAEGVPGADPADWYGIGGLTDSAPLAADGEVRVSPSALEEYGNCALRWLFGASGGQPPAPASVLVGTLIHDLAEQYPQAGTVQLQAELARRWPSLGLGDTWVSDQLRARAEQMLTYLVSYQTKHADQVVGRELPFSVTVGPARLVGRIDQLELTADGKLVAVDLKTTRNPPPDKEIPGHPQLGAYQVAVESGAFEQLAPGAGSGGAKLVQLGTKAKNLKVQPQPSLASAPDPQWAHQLIADAAAGMAGAQFAATVNETCQHCSLRASCPAQPDGQQVGR